MVVRPIMARDDASSQTDNDNDNSNDNDNRSRQNSLQCMEVDDVPPADAVGQNQFILTPTTRSRQLAVLICGFLSVVMTVGPNLSYGVFQEYYTTSSGSILPPNEAQNRGLVALVGTLAAGLTWGGSIFVNPLMSRVPGNANKKIATVGCVLMSLAYGLAGSCHTVSDNMLSLIIANFYSRQIPNFLSLCCSWWLGSYLCLKRVCESLNSADSTIANSINRY